MRVSLTTSFTLVLLTVVGCAGSRPTPPLDLSLPAGFPNHSDAEIRRQLLRSAEGIDAYNAKANLSVDAPAQGGRFSATLAQRRDDSLYVSISPGLGIEAARALVTPDSFFLYDRIQKRLLYGSLEGAGRVLPAPLTVDDLFHNMLGLLTPDPATDWRVRTDSVYYILEDPSGSFSYTIDPRVWRVVRYVERTAAGAIREERRFSDFDRFGTYVLPRRIIFRRPEEQTTASLYYRELELNPPPRSLALNLGDSVKRVPVE